MSKSNNWRRRPPLPPILRWTAGVNPLPVRSVRVPPRTRRLQTTPDGRMPPDTGPLGRPFDFGAWEKWLNREEIP